jgi:hypothetical protein
VVERRVERLDREREHPLGQLEPRPCAQGRVGGERSCARRAVLDRVGVLLLAALADKVREEVRSIGTSPDDTCEPGTTGSGRPSSIAAIWSAIPGLTAA